MTGGAGFIGSNLVDKLIEQNHRVIVIDDLSLGKKRHVNKKAEFHKINISSLDPTKKIIDLERIGKLFEGVDTIFHLAAKSHPNFSFLNPSETLHTNVIGTANLLEIVQKRNLKSKIIRK